MTSRAAEEREAFNKAYARAASSSITWFITEYPKLITQQNGAKPLAEMLAIYRNTSIKNHLRGSLTAAAQRGSSTALMFYGQYYIITAMNKPTEYAVVNAGLAGFLSGGVSSFVHSAFEPLKIRHEGFKFSVYKKAIVPMFWRHGLFDATFFAMNTLLKDYSYPTQFAVSALAASCVNLPHDLWKTQLIKALPARVRFMDVLRSLTMSEYSKQMLAKCADLGVNWGMTGLLYQSVFMVIDTEKA